jgi:hypothetical protein
VAIEEGEALSVALSSIVGGPRTLQKKANEEVEVNKSEPSAQIVARPPPLVSNSSRHVESKPLKWYSLPSIRYPHSQFYSVVV